MDENLAELAGKADRISRDEMKKEGIACDFFEARIYDAKSVGVQGDENSYKYPVEITIRKPSSNGRELDADKLYDLLEKIATRIPNEVRKINRVVYVITSLPKDTSRFLL